MRRTLPWQRCLTRIQLQAVGRKITGKASGTQVVTADLTSEPRAHDQLADNRTLTRSG